MSAPFDLQALMPCFQGVIPSGIATVAADGTPNVTYISQVHYVDERHVALSYQYFRKTTANLTARPTATLFVMSPQAGLQHRLRVVPIRIERRGPVFEAMRARLMAVATQTGMTGTFRLRGAVICEVIEVDTVATDATACSTAADVAMPALATAARRLATAADLHDLFEAAINGLIDDLGFEHVMLLVAEPRTDSLLALVSRGYPTSAVGVEVRIGIGTVGMAAADRRVVHVPNVQRSLIYSRAIRGQVIEDGGLGLPPETPMPGLDELASQLAVPVVIGDRLLGVLLLESERVGRFSAADRQAVEVLASQLAPLALVHERAIGDPGAPEATAPPPEGDAADFRFFVEDESIFLDGEYLIRGVAACILARLLDAWCQEQRTTWTNRELRADPAIALPAYNDNLEARLILLRKRLDAKEAPARLRRTGRGRFELVLEQAVRFERVGEAEA